LLKHDACTACFLARPSEGISSATSSAMIATTTSNSINVKPARRRMAELPENRDRPPGAEIRR